MSTAPSAITATLTNTAASSAIAPRCRRGVSARAAPARRCVRSDRKRRWTESADRISVLRQLAREPAALPAAAALVERRTVQIGNARFERLHVASVREPRLFAEHRLRGCGLRVAALKREPCG